MAYGPVPIADSFWRASVPDMPAHPQLDGDVRADIVVIGAGYTGLNAALALAEAGQKVVVLEAEQPGWGASGRNGGFCCLGGSKAGPSTMLRRFGADDTRHYYHAERAAVDHVSEILDRHDIDADRHSQGETLLAHRPRDCTMLSDIADEMRQWQQVECTLIARDELSEHGLASPEFYGAVTTPIGFALNPMKYVLGLAKAAVSAGARIFGQSGVIAVDRRDGVYVLRTSTGQVHAKTLIIATNGYSTDGLLKWLSGRYLPVQSNVLVTRPLTEDELTAQGWTSRQMCYDTRHLLHYFRLLPDNRMLFGLRGAMRTTPRDHEKTRAIARADFDRIFPAWHHVETPHFWSGLLSLSRNLTPFAGPVPGMDNCYAALSYHGNGVAMGSYAGQLLAAQILGQGDDTPAPLRVPPKRFELGKWRRAVLPFAYAHYGRQDRG